MAKKKRFIKRQEERKSVNFKIANHSTDLNREVLDDQEVESFFNGILNNQISIFGLKRLCKINLDNRYSWNSIQSHHPLPCNKIKDDITFIEYAILLGRDSIISALFKAGSSIFSQNCDCSCCYSIKLLSPNIIRKIKERPYQNIVWILRVLYELKSKVNSNMSSIWCENNDDDEPNRKYIDLCSQKSLYYHKITFPECQHTVCEYNFWKHFLSIDSVEDISCPICQQPLSYYMLSFTKPKHARKHQTSYSDDTNTRSWTKNDSLNAFLILPQEIPDDLPSFKPAFRACSLLELDGQYLGQTQDKRSQEMEQAVSSGRLNRIRALFNEGIDIDRRNEYGQTCCFLAVWCNRYDVLELLIKLGADHEVSDNLDTTPFQLAVRLRHINCIDIFQSQLLSGAFELVRENSINLKENSVKAEENFIEPTKNTNLQLFHFHQKSGNTDVVRSNRNITILISPNSDHPGAGSLYADGYFSNSFLNYLETVYRFLPEAPPEKPSCSHRSYMCDSLGWVRESLYNAVQDMITDLLTNGSHHYLQHNKKNEEKWNDDISWIPSEALPHMRFLEYRETGGFLAPHVDLSRRYDPRLSHFLGTTSCPKDTMNKTSTHTFILYLSDCSRGGETLLLRKVPGRGFNMTSTENTVAAVLPKRGRLLIFPHLCPHAGAEVTQVPKLLLRGEMI